MFFRNLYNTRVRLCSITQKVFLSTGAVTDFSQTLIGQILEIFKSKASSGWLVLFRPPLARFELAADTLQIPQVEAHADQRLRIVFMNPSSKDDFKSNQEAQAFDFPPIHEEEVVHPAADDDEKGSAEENEPTQIEEDKERTEMVSKEAMMRVTGGQL
jgi:hypothetical protein